VVAVTDAVVFHAEASARRLRTLGVTVDHPRRLDRRNALFVLLANLPLAVLPRAVARILVGSLIRTLSLLITKRPGAAKDELAAVGGSAAGPAATPPGPGRPVAQSQARLPQHPPVHGPPGRAPQGGRADRRTAVR
jgi:hypothetical protein